MDSDISYFNYQPYLSGTDLTGDGVYVAQYLLVVRMFGSGSLQILQIEDGMVQVLVNLLVNEVTHKLV